MKLGASICFLIRSPNLFFIFSPGLVKLFNPNGGKIKSHAHYLDLFLL